METEEPGEAKSVASPKEGNNYDFEEMVHRLTEAQHLPGDSGLSNEGRDIPWLNLDLAQRGQKFVKENMFSIAIAHTFVLIHLLSIKPIDAVLDKTGGFSGLERTLRRYFETVVHVLTWYGSDIIGKYSKGFKDICSVRRGHNSMAKVCLNKRNKGIVQYEGDTDELENSAAEIVGKVFKEDLDFLDTTVYDELNLSGDPPVFLSQLDMAMTHLSFIFPIVLYPKAYGIRGTSGMGGFIHLWALIGHMLGISDEFNFALNCTLENLENYVHKIMLPCIKDMDAIGLKLQFNLVAAMKKNFKFTSFASSYYFVLKRWDIPGYQGKNLCRIMSCTDKFYYYVLVFCTTLYYYIPLVRRFFNYCTLAQLKRMSGRMEARSSEDASAYVAGSEEAEEILWSQKYRARDAALLKKWKRVQSKVDMVTRFKKQEEKPNILSLRKPKKQ